MQRYEKAPILLNYGFLCEKIETSQDVRLSRAYIIIVYMGEVEAPIVLRETARQGGGE